MFWRFNYLTSEIDTLLDKEDVTLNEILNEEDVLQECKAQNKKLVDYLVRPVNFEKLINLVIEEPSQEIEERMRYKLPNIACELITSDVNQITEALAADDVLLSKLANYLESDTPLNPLQASFFSKVMGLLITRKSELTLNFLKSRKNFLDRVLRHLDTSAVMDLLLRLITSTESQECKVACIAWLSEEQIIQKLVKLLEASQSTETHSNAAQSLCDIIRISREPAAQIQDQAIPDTLLQTTESEETVTLLLSQMFDGEKVESVLTNGSYVLQTLLEFRKNGAEGQPEPQSEQETEKMAQGVSNTLKAIVPRLKDFHKLLQEPPKQHYMPMPTTLGNLPLPLGNTRLQTVRLIALLLANNSSGVNDELARLGTMNTILDLYFEYAWNNFLHTQVEHCIVAIIRNDSAKTDNVLLTQLLTECRLLERIVDAFDENQRQQLRVGGHRQGFMGHLTRIANSIVSNRVSSQNSQKIDEIVQGLSDDLRNRWSAFVSETLAELNKQNSAELLGGTASVPNSVSDADDEFRDIAFPQEVSAQKLGFNGDDFNEQEDISGALSNRLSSLSPTSCENSSTSEALFEELCYDRSSTMRTDRDDANDEDLWEEKELTFSPELSTSKSTVQETSFLPTTKQLNSDDDEQEVDKDDSEDSDEDLDSPRQIREKPVVSSENTEEAMELDEWAKFDEVPMDVAPVASHSPWGATNDAKNDQSTADVGWANFESSSTARGVDDDGKSEWSNFTQMAWQDQDAVTAECTANATCPVSDSRSSQYVVAAANDYTSGTNQKKAEDYAEVKVSTEGSDSSRPVLSSSSSSSVKNGPA